MISLTEYLNKYPKKHIVFDLDCTLAKLHIDWKDFRTQFRRLVSVEIDHQLVENTPAVNGSSRFLYNQSIQIHKGKAKRIVDEFCCNWEKNHYTGLTSNTKLIKFIKNNYKHYAFYIWTANTQCTVTQAIKHLQLRDYLRKIITTENTTLTKPYPDGFYLIFKESTQSRKDYLMVGDSEHDREAAKNSGIDFFCVNDFID